MALITSGPVSMNAVVRAASEQVSSEVGGEIVILDLAGGVYHGLDGVGARVWQLIQQPRRVSDIHDILVREYAVEADACARGLLKLLEELQSNRLLEIHGVANQSVHSTPRAG